MTKLKTQVTFLGVGSSAQRELGHAAMVVSMAVPAVDNTLGQPSRLLVDCGPGTINRYADTFSSLPDGVFITHGHMDHIADLEQLFFRVWLSSASLRPKLFVPLSIVALLHGRLAEYPGMLAEGGPCFWDAFQLIPVVDRFAFAGIEFKVYPARHNAPGSAFSLHLPGGFFFSGDTRPVPEVINHCIQANEVIFHDVSVTGNPAHTGLDDLFSSYSASQRERMFAYHYQSTQDVAVFEAKGIKVVRPGDRFALPSWQVI